MFFIKTRVLEKIDKRIKDLQDQRDLIEGLEIGPVDEKTWREICLTPARSDSELMIAIAKATFPEGEHFTNNGNLIIFTLNGFSVEVPTYSTTGITIGLGWYKPSYKEPPNEYRRFKSMRKYFELLDSGVYTWYDLACCRCNSTYISENKLRLFIWWFSKYKWRKIDRKKWDDMFEHEDEQVKKAFEDHERKVKEIEKRLSIVNDTIDVLKEFAEVKGYVKHDGIWQTMNVENYFPRL